MPTCITRTDGSANVIDIAWAAEEQRGCVCRPHLAVETWLGALSRKTKNNASGTLINVASVIKEGLTLPSTNSLGI
ncbi:hypothetical protein RRG08_058288 [Elysia crispata]|uniref:Uncharacterized protein n=1 Tax=Elysia crispata TaxID=231223 RepID=A0AAE0YVH8_9GAST|nr:hypothetical protein RRG08_058288 [Elysia crispata]